MDRVGLGQGSKNYPCDDLPGSEGNAGGVELRDDLKALAFPLRKRSTQNGSGKIVAKGTNISFKYPGESTSGPRSSLSGGYQEMSVAQSDFGNTSA